MEKFEKEKTGKEKDIENFEKQIKKLNEEKERIYREQGAFQKKKYSLLNLFLINSCMKWKKWEITN